PWGVGRQMAGIISVQIPAGGRVDPTRVRLDDISRSEGDRLLSMLRKRLRQKHRFPRSGKWGIPCVYSPEPQRFPDGAGGVCASKPEGTDTMRLDCHSGFGAASFVTGTFGFFAAKAAVDLLLRK
ncbi:MAG: tRNA cyclic N6-threonylcarbamoyladenosine(37) synthase TcdA, partial [Myxococcota bacterium]